MDSMTHTQPTNEGETMNRSDAIHGAMRPNQETPETIVLLHNGSPYILLRNICWVESENAFHGTADDGERFLFWDVIEEGTSKDYRRVTW